MDEDLGILMDLLIQHEVSDHSDRYQDTPLLSYALKNGKTRIFRYIKDTIDQEGLSALVIASRDGSVEVVRALLNAKVDVNHRPSSGQGALIFAISRRNESIARILVEHGADVNAADEDGLTPLIFAVDRGLPDTVEMLLKYGAKVEVTSDAGHTPLTLVRDEAIAALLQSKMEQSTSTIER